MAETEPRIRETSADWHALWEEESGKPVLDTFPDDVLLAARRAALPQYATDIRTSARMVRGECDHWPIVKVAARAIAAERKASADICTAIAADYGQWRGESTLAEVADQCAIAIRDRSKP